MIDSADTEVPPGGRSALLGSSPCMRALRRSVDVLGPLDCTVLITGETGTGKGLVARALHAESGRTGEPFVHVDCSALAPSVIESELFGHARGAFTGAIHDTRGRFELAAGGTLFLDEIGDLALPLQAKLLRVLQDRVFERVGCTASRRLHARILAATHRDLDVAVAEGAFRADLFYRVNVVRVEVPPLRERLDDLPDLIAGRGEPLPDAATLRAFRGHDWPGNVREFLNHLEHRAVQAELARRCGAIPDALHERVAPVRTPVGVPGEASSPSTGGSASRGRHPRTGTDPAGGGRQCLASGAEARGSRAAPCVVESPAKALSD